jgi:plastocyanin
MRTRTLLGSLGVGATTLVAALVVAPLAVGGPSATIAVVDNSFSPAAKSVGQGTSVTWSFQGTRSHTATSNQGFFDTGTHSSGTVSKTFSSAGRFPYHCIFHESLGMKGSIVVPLKAKGSAGSGWTLRWSTSAAPAGRAFDVQYRRQGTTTWHNLRTNTTAATALYNPAQAGTYELRARTTNTSANKESGWSPTISRQIS